MADHPLRPATDHRLGRPLPHQLANRPQAPPKAPPGFPLPLAQQSSCGISPPFEELSPTSGQVTHVLLTRTPLAPTRKSRPVRLTWVMHAASVHPEPGSNSPSESQQPLGCSLPQLLGPHASSTSCHSSVVNVPSGTPILPHTHTTCQINPPTPHDQPPQSPLSYHLSRRSVKTDRLPSHISRRPSKARANVTSSAYSRSPPTGRPRAKRVTRTGHCAS